MIYKCYTAWSELQVKEKLITTLRKNVPCQKSACPRMCGRGGRETASAHVHWGDAKGHCSGGQLPLKWHLKQTSSDKVVTFLCP